MSSYQYRKSHCGDKTILWPSYLHNGISYTSKMTSLYWIRALVATFSHVGGSFYRHHSRAFEWSHLFNLGLGAACWAHFICQHELWPSLSFRNSSWGVGGGKHYRTLSTEGGCGRHFENGVLEPYHMGLTANLIIKDIINISASISKNMHISLMGRHYHWASTA